jgi:aldose 1-epimerase
MTANHIVRLSSNAVEALIDVNHGARLSNLRFDGQEILSQHHDTDSLAWGCYPMVPWAGRMRDATFVHRGITHHVPSDPDPLLAPHAIHGLVHNAAWKIVSVSATRATLRIDFDHRWPFAGWVEHLVSVDDTSIEMRLTVSMNEKAIQTATKTDMPAQVGWHPWFVRPLQIQTAFKTMYVRDTSGIATTQVVTPTTLHMTGHTPSPLDDCFTDADAPPTLTFSNGLVVRLESDCSHWVVYNKPAHAICVEPQSGPPNGLNSEPLAVSPNQPLTRIFRLTALGYP